MTDLVGRLIAWATALFKPRRAEPGRPTERGARIAAPPPPHRPHPLDAPLDGSASALVRPYLTAHEQRQRRRALFLATIGLDDEGPYWIHGMEVA
ncbi:hypothetical protein LRD69_19635 [Streptomyces sp. JH14]|uniref:hypothetical protein n=1 Tax=Streptomyces sp. JH14 TaxID=2793630 RepID=UPI0023F79232|nr:hypothetical protein [Streptomyces sp. JH14]MDF6044307.1 hypothetical protein [Streptomyces sp. JH14]